MMNISTKDRVNLCIYIYLSIYCSTYLSFEPQLINPSHANPGGREKIKLNFYFHTFFCDASKGFMKALNVTK